MAVDGYWKGVALSARVHTVVHIYLDQDGEDLSGRFEAEEPGDFPTSGHLHGYVRGSEIEFHTREKEHFTGQVSDVDSPILIYGLVYTKESAEPVGTLTLFKQGLPELPLLMYGNA